MPTDNAIAPWARCRARLFQAVFPISFRLKYSSKQLCFATKPIADPDTITVPTRHGPLRCLLYRPTDADVAAARRAGRAPPVHVQIHGGAFIIRMPRQIDNVCRYLASEVGCFVVVTDYDTAPTVTFPVAEEQNYDVFQWVHQHGADHGWHGDRASVGGESAGGKLAISVVQQAIDAGTFVPVALTAAYACADVALPAAERTSAKRHPMVSTDLMDLVLRTYFAGVTDLTAPLVSPVRYDRLAEFPPTLITTGALDTLCHEMNDLATKLSTAGVHVTHHEFPDSDHGFMHTKPVEVARRAIAMTGEHLEAAYSR
jgi:acetyl esterase